MLFQPPPGLQTSAPSTLLRMMESSSGGPCPESLVNMRSSPASSSDEKQPQASSRILYDIPCKVCTDHSSGKHYGIFACDGCAGFFKVCNLSFLNSQHFTIIFEKSISKLKSIDNWTDVVLQIVKERSQYFLKEFKRDIEDVPFSFLLAN